MKPHPVANLFPMMDADALAALASDISEHGLREPIVCHLQMILDGRNRWKACALAGVTPDLVDFKGDDPLAFVLSANLHRRNMSESQRAITAARLANLPTGANQHTEGAQICAPSQDKAAELFQVSRRTVQHARTVLDSGVPALVKAVDSGKTKVSKAAFVAKKDPDEQRAWLANPKKQEKAWAAQIERARAKAVREEFESTAADAAEEKEEDEYYAAKAFVLRAGAATEAAVYYKDKPVTKEMVDAAAATVAAWKEITQEITERHASPARGDDAPPDDAAKPLPADLAEALATVVRHASSSADYSLTDEQEAMLLTAKAYMGDLYQGGGSEFRDSLAARQAELASGKAKRRRCRS